MFSVGYPSELKKRVFCSAPCRQRGTTIASLRSCVVCGKEFTPRLAAERAGQGRTCSVECGGVSRRKPPEDIRARQELGILKRRRRNQAFVKEVNARTFCAHCGAQPVEWHNPDHVEKNRQTYRIGFMTRTTRSLAAIQAEMDQCTPLCRRCHMKEDGRLRGFADKRYVGRGSASGSSKLTEDKVTEIRALRSGGARADDLADKYGVAEITIYRVLSRKTWTHI